MRVRCIRDRIEELPEQIRKWIKPTYMNYADDYPLNFVKGNEYIVYGIHFWDNHPFYFLCDSPTDTYPVPHYAGFFEIIDDKLSCGWKLVHQVEKEGYSNTALLYKKWAEDQMFYTNLVEGNEEEIAIFKQYKNEMDKEANY